MVLETMNGIYICILKIALSFNEFLEFVYPKLFGVKKKVVLIAIGCMDLKQ